MMIEEWKDVKEYYPEIYDEALEDIQLDYDIAMELAEKETGFPRLIHRAKAKLYVETYKKVIFPFLDAVTHRKEQQ